MHSEADIRREVEGRLRRRALLLLHGGLWAIITTSLYLYARYWGIPAGMESMPTGWTISATFFMLFWALIVGLHAFWVGYVEIRERVVHNAIQRERQYYLLRDTYEKRKPDRDTSLRVSETQLADDGELIDFSDEEPEENAKRNRDSTRG